jgi:hypothetical protein
MEEFNHHIGRAQAGALLFDLVDYARRAEETKRENAMAAP